MAMPRPELATQRVIYDDQCEFCRRQVDFIRRHDRRGRFQPEAASLGKWRDLLPERAERGDSTPGSLIVVTASGEVLEGAYSVRQIAAGLPAFSPLAFFMHLPGVMPVANWAYRLFARHRGTISRLLFGCQEACAVPSGRTSESGG
jgi:predicted DCC family thiol-disulfide oxidoreductase YuxK